MRDDVERHGTKELPVPPDGRFVVRFKAPADRDKLTPVVAAYRIGSALSAAQETQLLIDCCDEILRKHPKTGKLERVGGKDAQPLRFDAGDERWGSDIATARECVRKLYNLDVTPLAAAGVADLLIDWMQGLDIDIQELVEGKSGNGASSSKTPPDSKPTDLTE